MQPNTLQIVAASLFLVFSASPRAETFEMVVRGTLPSMGVPDPSIPMVENYIAESGGYFTTLAFPWGQLPVQVGDEMRVLLSFDNETWIPYPDYQRFCPEGVGGVFRAYGPVTGSVTIAGIVAVIDPGASFIVGRCDTPGRQIMVMDTPVAGPSLFTVPFPTYYEFPSVEMPMFQLFVSLPAPYTALCQNEDGTLASFELFMEQCSGYNGMSLGLRWFKDQICHDGGCGFRAEFTVIVDQNAGAPVRIFLPETSDYVDQLVAEVLVLNLDQGIESSLDAKIAEAVGASDNVELAKYATTSTQKASANQSARNRLGAFINAVNAQRGKAIPDAKADRLIALANKLAARL